MKSKPFKIALIAGELGLGGAERQLYYLATRLDRSRFTPLILTLNPGHNDYWETPIRESNVDVIEIPRRNQLLRARQIRSVIHDFRPDIIHAFHFYTNGYGVLAGLATNIPVIGGIRFLPSEERINRVPLAPWRWLCLRSVDCLVCNSKTSENKLHQVYSYLPEVITIPNGVPIPSAYELDTRRQDACRRLNKSDYDIYIGFVGWLNRNKNLSLLLAAFAKLRPTFPQVKLIVVGSGSRESELKEEVRELGLSESVVFLGSHPFAETLMPAFDILCLPSNSEGMPNVLMEAGASGIPLVATDVGGVSEIVEEGKTGFLTPKGDVETLSGRLSQLLISPSLRQRMGTNGRRHMQQEFSVNRMISLYQNLYQEVLGKSGTNFADTKRYQN